MARPIESTRLEFLDATRAFALVLGIVFHTSLSFLPLFIGWAVQDISTNDWVSAFVLVSHAFRLELFFLLAGFFAYQTLQRQGTRSFIQSRVFRILIPFFFGWFLLRPLLVSGWVMGAASLRGDYEFWNSLRAGWQSLTSLPEGAFTGTHLWFLYYLALITGLFLALRGLFLRVGAWGRVIQRHVDAIFIQFTTVRWPMLVLVLPTAAALWFMSSWGMDTPDRSLRPHIPVTLIYSGFFGFGWMLARQPEPLGLWIQLSWSRLFTALAGILATLALTPIQGSPHHRHYGLAHFVSVISYAVMMWSLVLLTLGGFARLYSAFQKEGAVPSRSARWRAAVRYIADSSYWLYLTHLPIVIWLQVAFAELPYPWWTKLMTITVITLAVLLLSYDAFVRSTSLGHLLNGRRRDRILFPKRVRSASVSH